MIKLNDQHRTFITCRNMISDLQSFIERHVILNTGFDTEQKVCCKMDCIYTTHYRWYDCGYKWKEFILSNLKND